MREQAHDLLLRIFASAKDHLTEIKMRANNVDTRTGMLNGYTPTDATTLQNYAKMAFQALKDTETEDGESISDAELIAKASEILRKSNV
jgi:branched-subunit amino acid permease